MPTILEAVKTVKDPIIPTKGEDDYATPEGALEACREWHRLEEARLLAEYEPYEPEAGDRDWLAPLDLAEESERWADYREWAEWAERVEEIHAGRTIRRGGGPISDEDLMAAGLPVG